MDAFTEAVKKARKGISYKTHYMLLKITAQLYERMKEKGLNFSKIAQKLNVSRARISALFSCQHNVTLKTLIAVADALDCELEIKLVPKEVFLPKREETDFSIKRKRIDRSYILPESIKRNSPQDFSISIKEEEYGYASAA